MLSVFQLVEEGLVLPQMPMRTFRGAEQPSDIPADSAILQCTTTFAPER